MLHIERSFPPQAGADPPRVHKLNEWKKTLMGMSTKAFETVKELTESRDMYVDHQMISQNFLKRNDFTLLKDKPGGVLRVCPSVM